MTARGSAVPGPSRFKNEKESSVKMLKHLMLCTDFGLEFGVADADTRDHIVHDQCLLAAVVPRVHARCLLTADGNECEWRTRASL